MKKIMFNDKYGLTDAVLQGRKTMTRRIAYGGEIKDIHTGYMTEGVDAWRLALCDGNMIVAKSKYKNGEVVAVAQSYKDAGIDPHFLMFQPIKGSTYIYFAEMEIEAMFTGGWNNKMFVRADHMPHQIRITDIKIERLQDISDEDAIKEGIRYYLDYSQKERYRFYYDPIPNYRPGAMTTFSSAKAAFAALIDKVSGKGTWESNPWVFAYEFELVK